MQLFDPYKKWTGRPTAYEDAEDLMKGCKAYFRWLEENPVKKKQLVAFQGRATEHFIEIPHAPTIKGLCAFLGIGESTWYVYRKHERFAHVCSQIDGFMHDFKFAHGAAEVFNPGLIARDLGLSDKQEVTAKPAQELSDEELQAQIDKLTQELADADASRQPE